MKRRYNSSSLQFLWQFIYVAHLLQFPGAIRIRNNTSIFVQVRYIGTHVHKFKLIAKDARVWIILLGISTLRVANVERMQTPKNGGKPATKDPS